MDFKILIKKLNDKLSEKEANIFNHWYSESAAHRSYFNRLEENYSRDLDDINVEKAWQDLSRRLSERKKKNSYLKYAMAASVALLISITFVVFNYNYQVSEPIIVNNDISVGTDKATLTLEDGSVVVLEKGNVYETQNASSNGENLVYQESSSKTAELTYNYLTIPRGGQFFIQLSDGTKIWLNSESKLKYPVHFIDGETREVELVYGEAYFDVSSSDLHKGSKFKVFNRFQEVEVVGTEFNIKAYRDEFNIYTTLIEGEVLVNLNREIKILAPNEQLNLNLETHNYTIKKIDVYSEISWKEGVFSFESKPLKEIMKVLSRWYNVDVIFENKALEKVKFFGVLDKRQDIQEILETIKKFGVIESYKIENQVIILK